MKITGDLVAATADNAPPPLAWLSSLVITTLPTSTLTQLFFLISYLIKEKYIRMLNFLQLK